jgi:hypothetical protein
MFRWYRFFLVVCVMWLGGCSVGQMAARSAVSIMDGGADAMNREADLELAASAIPANIKLLEGLVAEDPKNAELHTYAAQGLYGYAFGFVEDEDAVRASRLYRRCFGHGQAALRRHGLSGDLLVMPHDQFDREVSAMGKAAVPALFWSASCLAKWIDMNRVDPAMLSQTGKSLSMMQRVLRLDESFNHGSPHIFFGVYYGSLSPMFGGDPAKSLGHFDRARTISNGRLLLVDVLQAQFLARQTQDRRMFHDKLGSVLDAPDDIFPDMALVNAMARQKAARLLHKEEEWF